MRIAHLILAHTDFEHVSRLAKRLSRFSDVYIHIDAKKDETSLKELLADTENCYFVNKRYSVSWGGYSAVLAEIELLRAAQSNGEYDRITFLQGADYPLKTDKEIISFYRENSGVEFIRACECTGSEDKYFYSKCRYIMFYDNRNLPKKIWNKLSDILDLKLKKELINDGDMFYHVYWGAAQWSITGECGRYIVEFHEEHDDFNSWFKTAFPCDELYFNTIVMNSRYRERTTKRGPESARRGLENFRNLHYFEYLPGHIRTWTINDFEELKNKSDIYIRKVSTTDSLELIDVLDENNSKA